MLKRTFQDWVNAADRICHVSNDFVTISGLKNEFINLGYLDEMINELCDDSLKDSVSLNIFPRITMLSRLWIMHAYEVVRSLNEFDQNRLDSLGGDLAKFKTGRFHALMEELKIIRIPMVKQQRAGRKHSVSSYVTIKNAGKRNISFISDGVEISREDMARKVLEVVNCYERN